MGVGDLHRRFNREIRLTTVIESKLSGAADSAHKPHIIREPRIMPRGLSRLEAALYLGISPSKFDQLRNDGRVPPARLIDSRKVWDVRELDLFFEELPRDDDGQSAVNTWADA